MRQEDFRSFENFGSLSVDRLLTELLRYKRIVRIGYMQLKYHQATYDLLTKTYIDPKKAIEHYDEYDEAIHREESSAQRQKRRSEMLAWTKLELLHRPVQFAERNIKMLDTLERKHNVQFPAAVREWYSLDFVPEIMSVRGWGVFGIDRFKPLAEMERSEWLPDPKNEEWNFLYDEYIDQGGESLFFPMNAGDDPPVFARYGRRLIVLTPTFSTFMYLHFWDWHGQYIFEHSVSLLFHPLIPHLQFPAQYHIPFKQLRQRYTELISNLCVRFYDEHTRIMINNFIGLGGEVLSNNDTMAGAEIRTDTVEVLAETIKYLWGDDGPIFHMNGGWENNHTTMLLAQLQRAQLRKVLQQSEGWIAAPDLAYQLDASIPVLSTPMAEQLAWLIEQGEAEAHPDNRDDAKSDNRYRANSSH